LIRPTWELPWYSWISLRRNLKRGFWAMALTIAPLVFLYALASFVHDKASRGQWLWVAVITVAVLGVSFAMDFFSGRYRLFRKPRQEVLPPARGWVDEA